MARLFGFVQFDFAGRLPLADGRYLAGTARPGAGGGPLQPGRGGSSPDAAEAEAEDSYVLVVRTIGAPPAPRRRRGRAAVAEPEPAPLPLTRVTAIRASAPLADQAEAARRLDEACADAATVEALATEAVAPLNLALHAQAVASADPRGRQLAPEHAERVLIGYGSGEEAADGRFTDARQVDVSPRASSRRRRREQELRPQERVAAVLRGRERLDACETLLLRARADLDAGRAREAALQLRVGLEALLVELPAAVRDPGHERDMATLRDRQTEAAAAAKTAIAGDLRSEQRAEVEELLDVCERVLRRRAVLRG